MAGNTEESLQIPAAFCFDQNSSPVRRLHRGNHTVGTQCFSVLFTQQLGRLKSFQNKSFKYFLNMLRNFLQIV